MFAAAVALGLRERSQADPHPKSPEGSGMDRQAQGLGAVVAGEVGLKLPGREQHLGDAAQLNRIVAGLNGPGAGFDRKLAGEGKTVQGALQPLRYKTLRGRDRCRRKESVPSTVQPVPAPPSALSNGFMKSQATAANKACIVHVEQAQQSACPWGVECNDYA